MNVSDSGFFDPCNYCGCCERKPEFFELFGADNAETGNLLYNRTAEAFETETAPDGTPWKPLADSTRESKNDKGKMLWEDGHLQRSLSVKVDGQTVTLGLHAQHNGFPYPTTHQFGTDKAGRGNSTTIPARPFLPITDNHALLPAVEKEVLELIEEWVLGGVKKI